MTTATANRNPATDKQAAFIGRLLNEKAVPAETADSLRSAVASGLLTRPSASSAITWLLSLDDAPAETPAYQPRHAHPYTPEREAATEPVGPYTPRHLREDTAAAPVPARRSGMADEGYYVRGDEAFRVVANKAGTATYAKALRVTAARMWWEYAPGVGRDLAAEGLVPMTAAEAGRLGLLHGRCVNCCRPLGGESLSAQVSALIGYGETCAGNNGWEYPTGAAAQRAYLAAH